MNVIYSRPSFKTSRNKRQQTFTPKKGKKVFHVLATFEQKQEKNNRQANTSRLQRTDCGKHFRLYFCFVLERGFKRLGWLPIWIYLCKITVLLLISSDRWELPTLLIPQDITYYNGSQITVIDTHWKQLIIVRTQLYFKF